MADEQKPADLVALGMANDEPKIQSVMSVDDAAQYVYELVNRLGEIMTPNELYALGMATGALYKVDAARSR